MFSASSWQTSSIRHAILSITDQDFSCTTSRTHYQNTSASRKPGHRRRPPAHRHQQHRLTRSQDRTHARQRPGSTDHGHLTHTRRHTDQAPTCLISTGHNNFRHRLRLARLLVREANSDRRKTTHLDSNVNNVRHNAFSKLKAPNATPEASHWPEAAAIAATHGTKLFPTAKHATKNVRVAEKPVTDRTSAGVPRQPATARTARPSILSVTTAGTAKKTRASATAITTRYERNKFRQKHFFRNKTF